MRPRLPALATLVLLGCADAPRTNFTQYEPAPGTPERVAWEAGITRYLGTAPPESEVSSEGGVTTFTFDTEQGPLCMRGAPFRASVRETQSEDLLIFLQGGGACWSAFCLAITAAPAGIPSTDLLRREEQNPLADWDVLYVPYCDGSLFAGDRDVDEDGDGAADRFHRGLANLSAALAAGHERFPTPRRIVLAGSSGGGYGTILAAFLVRYVWPGVRVDVLNDAGLGVARDGDVAFLDTLIDDFGARSFIPEGCPECTARGHITGLVRYLLDHDPDVRVAAISSWRDYVISEVFLGTTAEAFEASLAVETGALHEAHPERYRRFLFAGAAHTALLGDVSGIIGRDLRSVELPPDAGSLLVQVEIASMHDVVIDGVTLVSWVSAMLEDHPAWDDRLASDEP
jgi:hypothetical protein